MINCNKCDVQRFCGTVVSSIKLCQTVHPEWWKKENDNKAK